MPCGGKGTWYWADQVCRIAPYPHKSLTFFWVSHSCSGLVQRVWEFVELQRALALLFSIFFARRPSTLLLCASDTMAAVAATPCATVSACLVQKSFNSASQRAVARPVVGLPALQRPRIACSAEGKEAKKEEANGLPQLAAAMTSAATMAAAHPALALVDERLSTEGTGLSLGLSNSNLGWILVGVTALIWALYFVYSSGLPEGDDESGLSL